VLQRTWSRKSFHCPLARLDRMRTSRLTSVRFASSSVRPLRRWSVAVSERALSETIGDVPRFACHWAKMPHACGASQSRGKSVDHAYQ
jgi:hypothetical protein